MEHTKQYFVLPECCIAFNAKVASSSLACSIVRKYYPDRYQKAVDDYNFTWSRYSQKFKDSLPETFQVMFRTDFESSKSFWQNVCLRTRKPDKKVLLLVRDPVVRFASTCAYMQKDVEQVLQALEKNTNMILEILECNVRTNTHFLPQHIYMDGNCKAYKLPIQLEQMCNDAGLDYPLPKINEGKHEKPILTEDQIERVKTYYKEDFDLFNSL